MNRQAERIRKLGIVLDGEARTKPHSIRPGKTYLTQAGLNALQKQGDEAMRSLNESAARHERRQAIWARLRTFFRRLLP